MLSLWNLFLYWRILVSNGLDMYNFEAEFSEDLNVAIYFES